MYSVHKKKKLFWRLQRTTRQVPPVEEQTRTEDPKVGGVGRKEMPFVGKFSTNLHTETEESEYGKRIGYFWWRHLFPICSYLFLFVPILRCMEVYGVLVGPSDTAWRFVELIDWDFYMGIYNPDSVSEVLYRYSFFFAHLIVQFSRYVDITG